MKKKNTIIKATLLVTLIVVMTACSNSPDNAISNKNHPESQNISPKIEDLDDADTVTIIEGRKTEFINRLDNIQAELDAMPEKEGSDKGETNAMKSYYGLAYEMYDKELNEIYALLKEELSPETMKELKDKQIKWIEQKEKNAEEEKLKFNGGTFEYVAWYISLYESTKDKCYELVNEYMTD